MPFTAFPLIFVKHFQRSWPADREGPETVPEADSDFEEITPAENQTVRPLEFIVDVSMHSTRSANVHLKQYRVSRKA